MSRSRECTRCAALYTELLQWRQDYKDLALAMANGQGYKSSDERELEVAEKGAEEAIGAMSPAARAAFIADHAEPALPGNIFTAIEDTTDRSSEPRRMAIEWARAALDSGMTPEDVEAQLRHGEEIKI